MVDRHLLYDQLLDALAERDAARAELAEMDEIVSHCAVVREEVEALQGRLDAVIALCDAADLCPVDGTTPIDACDCYPDEYHDREIYAPVVRTAATGQ